MAQIERLSEELQKIANEELGEVPARIPKDLQALKTWIQQQPHLKARIDDQFLIQFLRGCKYSLERAKEKTDAFYSMKTKYPELFSLTDVDNPKFRKFHQTATCTVLPTPLNGCGPRIMFIRHLYSAQEFNVCEVFQYLEAILEVMLMTDPYACIYGVMVVFDWAKITANHLLQVTPNLAKQIAHFYEKTFPVRLKMICFMNLPKYAEHFFKMVLPVFPEKFRNRVSLSSGMDNVIELLSSKYLPREYGGEADSLDQIFAEHHSKLWDENRQYFKQNAEYGSDERLRLGKPFDFDDALGVGGSFRKLNVD